MDRRRWLAVLAALLCGPAIAQPDDPGLYLFQIHVDDIGGPEARGATVAVELHTREAERLAQRLAATSVATLAVDPGAVRVAVDRDEVLTGELSPEHLEPSFVIDFDESVIEKLVRKLRAEHGDAPTIDALVSFVDQTIAVKSYRRSFDLASETAANREGDCTEHAVLLAAIARATGKPARVALGVLLIETPDETLAFGHAWTEIHDGAAWRIADATLPGLLEPDASPRYIPIMGLVNEGPGYAFQIAGMSAVFPARIAAVRTP